MKSEENESEGFLECLDATDPAAELDCGLEQSPERGGEPRSAKDVEDRSNGDGLLVPRSLTGAERAISIYYLVIEV